MAEWNSEVSRIAEWKCEVRRIADWRDETFELAERKNKKMSVSEFRILPSTATIGTDEHSMAVGVYQVRE